MGKTTRELGRGRPGRCPGQGWDGVSCFPCCWGSCSRPCFLADSRVPGSLDSQVWGDLAQEVPPVHPGAVRRRGALLMPSERNGVRAAGLHLLVLPACFSFVLQQRQLVSVKCFINNASSAGPMPSWSLGCGQASNTFTCRHTGTRLMSEALGHCSP